jgi:hypothetical protein
MFPQIDGLDRGTLLFRDVSRRGETLRPMDDNTVARAFFTTSGGPASFDLWLQAGHYDVFYASSAHCDIGGSIPCGTSIVAQDVAYDTDAMRDFDLRPTQLVVTLTRGGLSLPDATDRGAARLESLDARFANRYPLTATGPARIETTVARGRYRVFFTGAASGCETIACGDTLLDDELVVEDAISLTTELRRAFVRGRVTVNGQPFEFPAGTTASLAVVGVDTGLVQTLPVVNGEFGTPSIGAGRYYTLFVSTTCDPATPDNVLCASEIVECP